MIPRTSHVRNPAGEGSGELATGAVEGADLEDGGAHKVAGGSVGCERLHRAQEQDVEGKVRKTPPSSRAGR